MQLSATHTGTSGAIARFSNWVVADGMYPPGVKAETGRSSPSSASTGCMISSAKIWGSSNGTFPLKSEVVRSERIGIATPLVPSVGTCLVGTPEPYGRSDSTFPAAAAVASSCAVFHAAGTSILTSSETERSTAPWFIATTAGPFFE